MWKMAGVPYYAKGISIEGLLVPIFSNEGQICLDSNDKM